MKIVFNCLNSGLANNGGSRTVIRCAQTIEKLGHKCDIASTVDTFDWFEHKAPVSFIPWDTDVVVATACTTVASTLESNVKKKAWYIRGHETWQMDERVLGELYRARLHNITNSYGLQKKLKDLGAAADVVHQGIDLEWWYSMDYVRMDINDEIVIGCLYQQKDTKRWEDFIKLSKILGRDGYSYIGFGAVKRDDDFLYDYWCQPSLNAQREMYSKCHVWFAPTELEGLHNVPMEAALCGCLIVCSDSPMNGMIYDYANEESAIVYPARDIEYAADAIKLDCAGHIDMMIYNMQHYITNEIGSREHNMEKFVDILEKL